MAATCRAVTLNPLRPFHGVAERWTAPAPPDRLLPRRRVARPWATCGKHPGAVGPSQMVNRCPPAPLTGSVADVVRGYNRLVAGWLAWDHHRPGGSLQVAVGLPPALPPSAAGSGAPAIGCTPSHTPPLFSQRGPRRPLGRPVDPSSPAGRGRWMGLQRGCPPSQASSGGLAGLPPTLGPTRGNDPPAPASCPSAPGVVFGEDQRVTSLAPQVASGWAGCMAVCRLPRPWFRHQCNKVQIWWKTRKSGVASKRCL